ncbi:Deleted in lung and esophageal cancer protein 1 [Irineochytrium annulatum]|nr:Deleted in lung and esophageal cancer protein 1 [Irineochytrium annulatum]
MDGMRNFQREGDMLTDFAFSKDGPLSATQAKLKAEALSTLTVFEGYLKESLEKYKIWATNMKTRIEAVARPAQPPPPLMPEDGVAVTADIINPEIVNEGNIDTAPVTNPPPLVPVTSPPSLALVTSPTSLVPNSAMATGATDNAATQSESVEAKPIEDAPTLVITVQDMVLKWPDVLMIPDGVLSTDVLGRALVDQGSLSAAAEPAEECEETRLEEDELKELLQQFLVERENHAAYINGLREKVQAIRAFIAKIQRHVDPPPPAAASVQVEVPGVTAAIDDDNSTPLDIAPQMDEGNAEAREVKALSEGLFDNVKKYGIRRTDSHFKRSWQLDRGVLKGVLQPGILEVDSELAGAGLGALEPRKPPRAALSNAMHPYAEEELRLIANMQARVGFLRNPRFPAELPEAAAAILRDDSMLKVKPWVAGAVDAAARSRRRKRLAQGWKGGDAVEGRIIATPDLIFFTNYVPHHTYSKLLSIRNKTPHSTRYFCITLIETPKKFNGLVAPGMSCQYRIDFVPDSLADFELTLVVTSEVFTEKDEVVASPNFFTVPIIAKRERPELTIPDVLHCGPCRAGFVAVRRWKYTNIGGPGRFLLAGQQSKLDPYATFERLRNSKEDAELLRQQSITEGAYEISPAFFEVGAGESGELVVVYKAKAITDTHFDLESPMGTASTPSSYDRMRDRLDEIVLKIACDNCQVLQLPVRGISQKPSVEISGFYLVDARSNEKQAVERSSSDVNRPNSFNLGSQNVHAVTACVLTVHNNTRLRLPFKWIGVDYAGKGAEIEGETWSTTVLNDSFHFLPVSGHLLPNADTTFNINFKPQSPKIFDVIGRLLLLEEDNRVDDAGQIHEKLSEDSRELECALEINCRGVGIDYELSIKPEIVIVPSPLYVGSEMSTSVRLRNNSISDVAYELTVEGVSPAFLGLKVESPQGGVIGTVAAGSADELLIRLEGLYPGFVEGVLVCRTASGVGPTIRVPLVVRVDIKPGDLEFEDRAGDFGLLALGSKKTISLPLVNRSKKSMRYRLLVFAHDEDDEHSGAPDQEGWRSHPDWSVVIQPHQSVIDSGRTEVIQVLYGPKRCQKFRGHLVCELLPDLESKGLSSLVVSCIELRADVQTPRARLVNPSNSVTCFSTVPFAWKVLIQNETYLHTKYQWKNVESAECTAVFTPESCDLGPAQEAEVSITVTFKSKRVHKGFEFLCYIDGMAEDDGVLRTSLDAYVLGQKVKFRILEPALESGIDDTVDVATLKRLAVKPPERKVTAINTQMWPDGGPYCLDFGLDCPVFGNRTRTLVIRNKTAIASPYRTWVETYTAMGVDESDDADDDAGDRQIDGAGVMKSSWDPFKERKPGSVTLRPTKKEKIGFNSEAGKAWIEGIKAVRRTVNRMNRLLREGRGAAFHATPSYGVIEPFGEVRIDITSYNNLAGTYEDRFVCEIGAIRETIPIYMGVIGPVEGEDERQIGKERI